MYVDLMQYLHFVTCVVVDLDAIPSLVVLDITPQDVYSVIQNEHGNVMEDNE
jgi:hypothetical protein